MPRKIRQTQACTSPPGPAEFRERCRVHRTLLVGGDGIDLGTLLAEPDAHWTAP